MLVLGGYKIGCCIALCFIIHFFPIKNSESETERYKKAINSQIISPVTFIYFLLYLHCTHTHGIFLFHKVHCFGVLFLCEINDSYFKAPLLLFRGMTDITEGGDSEWGFVNSKNKALYL